MLTVLQISDHAYLRASERLCVEPEVFALWCAQTRPQWLRVNAYYFVQRNVKVCQEFPLYTHVWEEQSNTWLCLPVSADHCLKTVIDYENREQVVELPKVYPGRSLRKSCPRLARIKAMREERERSRKRKVY